MNRRERRAEQAKSRHTGGKPEAQADRQHLLNENRIGLMLGLTKLRAAASWRDMVLFVADTRDPVGARLAQVGGFDLADAEPVGARGHIPTVLGAISAASASAFLAESQPNIAGSVLVAPAPGRVRAIVVGGGGAALMHIVEDRVDSLGDA